MSIKKYAVSYSLPYEHHVTVGIEAPNKQAAIGAAQKAFDEGTIWDDTPIPPLLGDDFYEQDDGSVLTFEAERVGEFSPDASVLELRRDGMAKQACRRLVEAYRQSNTDGASIDWSDIDIAHELALEALKVE